MNGFYLYSAVGCPGNPGQFSFYSENCGIVNLAGNSFRGTCNAAGTATVDQFAATTTCSGTPSISNDHPAVCTGITRAACSSVSAQTTTSSSSTSSSSSASTSTSMSSSTTQTTSSASTSLSGTTVLLTSPASTTSLTTTPSLGNRIGVFLLVVLSVTLLTVL